jgi:two-component system sensor histidine kinase AtoS
MFVAFQCRADDSPFTYPEIRRLQNAAELMDDSLTRCRRANLLSSQAKLDYLAVASRGLAHDLNNLLTPISSFFIHVDQSLHTDSTVAEVYSSARRSVQMMTEYVRETLFFCQRMTPKFECTSLEELFARVTRATADRANAKSIRILTQCSPAETIMADRVLLERALVNLVHNSIDASPIGGIVQIAVCQRTAESVRIDVIDEGSGIADEHITRVCDPYFTTKTFTTSAGGLGLGLTISEKIVLLHSGRLSVSSRLNKGTTITVEIPLAQNTLPPDTA